MNYLKGALSAIAAVTLVLFGPLAVMAVRYHGKAIGAEVLTGALLSPVFWLCVAVLAGLFWIAGRAGNRILRVALFWIPASFLSAIGCIILAFVLYVSFAFRTP